MPYKSFRELAGESGNVNSAFQTSYTKTFLIEVDSATDSVFYVGSHPQLPRLYSQHPADNRAFCVSINPQQDHYRRPPCVHAIASSSRRYQST